MRVSIFDGRVDERLLDDPFVVSYSLTAAGECGKFLSHFNFVCDTSLECMMFDPPATIQQIHEYWMWHALDQAQRAFEQDEVPVGAVVVHQNRVVGEGYNQRETLNDPTAHAEMIAITQAAEQLQSWRLIDCTLYVTLEPCPMCAGAIVQARVPRLVYGTLDPKAGACNSLYQITEDTRLNHQVNVTAGVLQEQGQSLLKEFFAIQRAKGKK